MEVCLRNAMYFYNENYLCLKCIECAPGLYKGRTPISGNMFCKEDERDACVPCNGTKIKSVSGDDPTLCTETCDGVTNVANADHTACGKIVHNEILINVFI